MIALRKQKKGDPIRFTMYIPPEVNEIIEFLRYKEGLNKNAIMLNALAEYLPEQLKKYPEYLRYCLKSLPKEYKCTR